MIHWLVFKSRLSILSNTEQLAELAFMAARLPSRAFDVVRYRQ